MHRNKQESWQRCSTQRKIADTTSTNWDYNTTTTMIFNGSAGRQTTYPRSCCNFLLDVRMRMVITYPMNNDSIVNTWYNLCDIRFPHIIIISDIFHFYISVLYTR